MDGDQDVAFGLSGLQLEVPPARDRTSAPKVAGGLSAIFSKGGSSKGGSKAGSGHFDVAAIEAAMQAEEAQQQQAHKRVTKAEMVQTFEDHKMGALRALTVSPDSATLYCGGEDKCIRVWCVRQGACALQHTLTDAHGGWIWTLIVSPDGQILFSGSGDCTIRMWAIGQGGPPEPSFVLQGHEESVCSLAISREGTYLYSGSDDRSIRVWDVSAGLRSPPQLLQVLTGHTGYVSSLTLSPDCLTLYSAGMSGDDTIKMWRVCGVRTDHDAGEPAPQCSLLTTLVAHTMGVYTITLSPDGKLLYSGGEDKSILVWGVNGAAGTATLLQTLEGAHDKWVRSLRLTPDGRTLVSGSADTTIGLWAVEPEGTAKLLHVLRWHTDRVRCVRVSPDGRWLYSASSDRTIRLWRLESEWWRFGSGHICL